MSGNFVDSDLSHRHTSRGHGLGGIVLPREGGDTPTSSEDAVRYSKSSESVASAFSAEGFGSPPTGLAALVADYVNRSTRDIPLKTIAHMAPGSGNLGTAAAAGVNIVLGALSPAQREVMKAGGNPLSPADMQSIGAKLGLAGYVGREASLGGNNGGRFAGMREASGDGRSASGVASIQQINALGKMSGNDFATHLGFHGEQAREFGNIFNGTSGAFRSKAEDYKRAMGDPNATPEQKQAAAEAMKRAAKTKKEKDAAQKFQDAVEKMKADGVDINNPEAIKKYGKEHPIVESDKKRSDQSVKGKTANAGDKIVAAEVAATAAAAPSAKKDKPAKPATIQATL